MSISAYEPAWISVADGVEVVGAGAAGRDDVAADGVVRAAQERPSHSLDLLARSAAVGDRHDVALVAHHAAHLEPACAGLVGEAAGVVGRAAAARQARR